MILGGGCDKFYVGETSRDLNTITKETNICHKDYVNNTIHPNPENHLMNLTDAKIVIKGIIGCT